MGKILSPHFLSLFIESLYNLRVRRTGIKSRMSSNLGWVRDLPAFEGPIDLGKFCPGYSDFIFYYILIRLAGDEDSHNILDEFDFEPDQIIHIRVTCPLVSHRHIMGKCCPDDSVFIFYRILIKRR